MIEINTVMSWLEGLADDDWADLHSDTEVQNIATAGRAGQSDSSHGIDYRRA